jgi:hypothetical protein
MQGYTSRQRSKPKGHVTSYLYRTSVNLLLLVSCCMPSQLNPIGVFVNCSGCHQVLVKCTMGSLKSISPRLMIHFGKIWACPLDFPTEEELFPGFDLSDEVSCGCGGFRCKVHGCPSKHVSMEIADEINQNYTKYICRLTVITTHWSLDL